MAQAAVAAATWVATSVGNLLVAAGANTVSVIAAAKWSYIAAYTVSSIALQAGVAYAIDAISRPKLKPPGSELQFNIDPDYPREMIIGQRLVGGSMVARYSRGSNLYNAHLVIQLADHPCVELSKVYDGGRLVRSTPLTHGTRTEITAYSNSGGARVWMTWWDGRPGQVADSDLVTKSAQDPEVVAGKIEGWTSNHKGAGCAYVHVEVQWDSDILTSLPQFQFLVKGAKLYDRRKDTTAGGSGAHRHNDPATWEYSTNAMVAMDHFLLGYKVEADPLAFGIGLSKSEVPYAQFAAAADLCDEDVVTGVGGAAETIKRYAVNGVISAGDYFEEVVEAFQLQMAARVVDLGGRIGILGAEERAVVVSLTEDDLVAGEPLQFADKLQFTDLIGTVTGTFADPANNYQPTAYEPLVSAYAALPDGGEAQATSLVFPYEVHPRRVVRLATAWLERESLQPRLAGVFMPKAWKLEPGDWFEFTSPRLQVTAAKFEVVDIVKNEDFTVLITARSIDPNFLAFDNDNDPSLSVPPDVAPVARIVDTPTFAASATTITGGGATEPVIQVVADAPNPVTRELILEAREWNGTALTGPSILHIGHADDLTSIVRQALKPNTAYKVRMKARAGARESAWSDWSAPVTTSATYTVPHAAAASSATAGSALDLAIGSMATAAASAAAAAASASAAATHASNAALAETNAETAETAAEAALASATTQANNAATSASAAGASASSASGSAATATTQAANASTSASAAQVSLVAARTTAIALFPRDFAQDGMAWTNTLTGAPTSVSDPATPATTYSDVSGIGRVSQRTGAFNLAPKGVFTPVSGRSYRFTVRLRRTTNPSGGSSGVTLFAYRLDSSYGVIGNATGNATGTLAVADGWVTRTFTWAAADLLSGSAAYIRPRLEVNDTTGDGVLQVASFVVEDVTDSVAAAGSASAAASSASSAATSQSAAASSASAASTSATNASTSAGAASTSATNAANSATTASGHAATASTQATNAANSATAAAGSASAAASSATTASTQATNASNSASAAASSAVSARSTAIGIGIGPSDFASDGFYWTNDFGGTPASVADPATATYANVSGVGRVMQQSVSAGSKYVTQKYALTPQSGRKYKLTAQVRVTADATGGGVLSAALNINGLSTSHVHGVATWTASSVSGFPIDSNPISVATGWVTIARLFTPGTPGTYDAFWRPRLDLLRTGGAGGTFEVGFLRIEDVTDSEAAAASATAAATSASSAATSASSAGTSASAASTSATTASTQAASASTSATNASTSATNASTSASAASTSATNAAASASSASSSASTATSQASAASASASSAASSASTAASFATAAGAGTRTFDFQLSGSLWTNSVSGSPTSAADPSSATYSDVSAVGKVHARGGAYSLCTKYVFQPIASRTYKLNARLRRTIDIVSGSAAISLAAYRLDSAYAAIGNATGTASQTITVASGWVTLSATFTAADLLAGSAAYIRPRIETNGDGASTVQVQSVWVEDVTDITATNASVATNTSAIATETTARAAADTVLTAATRNGQVALAALDFTGDGLNWTTTFGGSPATVADPASVTYLDVGRGRALETTTFPLYLTPKALIRPTLGRRYRITAEVRATESATGGTLTASVEHVNGLDTGLAHGVPNRTLVAVSGLNASQTIASGGGWVSIATEFYLSSFGTYDHSWRPRLDITRSAGTGGRVQVRKVLIEDVTDVVALNASVTEVKTAVTEAGGAYAYYGIKVAAGNRFASIEAMAATKTNVSQLKMTADKFTIQTATTDKQVFDVTGSLVKIAADLEVGGGVTVGAARLKVALESIRKTGVDGAAITWAGGVSIGSIPEYVLDLSSLAPLATGEQYNVQLTSVTATGATVYAKIATPGTTSTVSQTTDAAGGGGDPTRVMAKSDSADAYDGVYQFRVVGTVTVTGVYDGEVGSYINTGSCAVSTWFNDGGGWDEGPTIIVDYFTIGTDQTGAQSFDVKTPVNWGNAIGSGGTYDFGVTAESGGTVTDLHTVSYTKQTSSGTRTASPNGETVKITAFPRNA